MLPQVQNLFAEGLATREEGRETFTDLLQGKAFRLEHIISRGEASEPGFWYDQDVDEWVLLAMGTAALEFEDGTLELKAGDAVYLPSHLRHRVSAVSMDAVWLAIHFQ